MSIWNDLKVYTVENGLTNTEMQSLHKMGIVDSKLVFVAPIILKPHFPLQMSMTTPSKKKLS